MSRCRKNNESLRFFPYGGYDPFHKESVSHHPELIEPSPPRPPFPAPAQGLGPEAAMGAFLPPPGPGAYMNPQMLPPRPPYPYNPYYMPQGGNGKQPNMNAAQSNLPSLPNGFPFGNGSFPGGQQFPFNQQQPFQNPGGQFSWGKTFNGINSAMGMMQQLGSIISIFK
ncbi:hypothetical protein QUF84_13885 [Fictibacillus enclensis]|uniref:hypothetical protein n=1 Tax=Fictibacillus enclensis TaxID=1017270 RepID=UPI0025A12395|nr:hypothetical protein [Fictibacillus enclensis]MDM5338310.1 hypothetical protein [Fictibacillus enclensis]